jgi:hypothetical protein
LDVCVFVCSRVCFPHLSLETPPHTQPITVCNSYCSALWERCRAARFTSSLFSPCGEGYSKHCKLVTDPRDPSSKTCECSRVVDVYPSYTPDFCTTELFIAGVSQDNTLCYSAASAAAPAALVIAVLIAAVTLL